MFSIYMNKNKKNKKKFFNKINKKSRKKEARKHVVESKKAQTLRGIKAKIFNKQKYKEKVLMRK